jgi:glycosyltransferase involved in cell wall biosynthesis
MKTIIQIPCFNEAEHLAETIMALPKSLAGIETVEVLIIDDGSDDNTSEIARECKVDHLIILPHHTGLAQAFSVGLDACLKLGADIIVNTDADNQYKASEIQNLINPILEGKAEFVIGDRVVTESQHFSPTKRRLQKLGSKIVSKAAGLKIPDATSGFRAMTREHALRTNVLSSYSYTLETLIQAGIQHTNVAFVPIETNPDKRPSRLYKNTSQYLFFSAASIMRAFTLYRPLRIFLIVGSIFLLSGIVLGIRFLVNYFNNTGAQMIQSLILAAILIIIGFQVYLIGIIADLIGFNRKLLEEILYRLRKSDSAQK